MQNPRNFFGTKLTEQTVKVFDGANTSSYLVLEFEFDEPISLLFLCNLGISEGHLVFIMICQKLTSLKLLVLELIKGCFLN